MREDRVRCIHQSGRRHGSRDRRRTLPFTVDFASWPATKRRHSPAAGNWMLPSHDAAMTRRRRRLVSSKCYCTRRLWRNPDQRHGPRDSALATGASIGAPSAMAVPGNLLAPFVDVGWRPSSANPRSSSSQDRSPLQTSSVNHPKDSTMETQISV